MKHLRTRSLYESFKPEKAQKIDPGDLASLYMDFKESVIRSGYADEVDWQTELDFESITESDFLREAAWVVLSSGFRESVVRGCFQHVSEAFLEWCSAERIDACRDQCKTRAISVFGCRRKIEAIAEIVETVAHESFECIKLQIQSRGIYYLQKFPFIGPTTSYHLAKNIGIGVVKPDRHLVRMAHISGHNSPIQMCSVVSATVGDSIAVVDLVFWRYATLNSSYRSDFESLMSI